METGASLMDYLLKFDELCLKLRAAGDSMHDDEQLDLVLGSLSFEYDDMVRIIEAHICLTLLDARRCSAGSMTLFISETKRKLLSRHMLSVMNIDAFEVTEDTVDKKKIEIATNLLEDERLIQVFRASASDVDDTDTKYCSVVR